MWQDFGDATEWQDDAPGGHQEPDPKKLETPRSGLTMLPAAIKSRTCCAGRGAFPRVAKATASVRYNLDGTDWH